MLQKLSVQNYALIRDLNLELEKGLTIITGETGAGKSILLGALSIVLGTRADTSVLLDKSEKCIVEATFSIDGYNLDEFFTDNDIDFDPVAVLRREINSAGKSRAFINDTPVTINLLKELGDHLIDIHSQHQTLMLQNSSFQLDVIDSFADNSDIKREYHKVYSSYRALFKEFIEATSIADKNRADIEYYTHQVKELEEAKLIEGEQTELEREQELLNHASEIKLGLSTASELLVSDSHSVVLLLKDVKNSLSKIKDFLPGNGELLTRIESVYIELNDLANETEKLAAITEADPKRLELVTERLDLIWSLEQKHRVSTVEELISKRNNYTDILKTLISGDERLGNLGKLVDLELSKLGGLAIKLSDSRRSVIEEVEENVTNLLKQLGMPNAKFRIKMDRADDYSSSGTDKIDFLFSANKQIEPENLSRVASGGELSRVMLCLKSLLTKNNELPTIIFDEIDAGVSGDVADRVGQILAGMGNRMQVINITHLPQVASRGKKHYHVYKDETDDSTITRIRLLSPEERVKELARLLSGSEITETAMRNATELLNASSE